MPSSQAELSARQVLAFFDEQDRDQASEPIPPPEQVRAYREAAAVLAAIAHPDQLRPVGTAATAGEAIRILCGDLVPATGRAFQGELMLAPDVRLETLRELVASGRIPEALAANPEQRSGSLQSHLEQCLAGTAPPLESQSLAELEETHQVVVWLRDAIEGLPTEQQVQSRVAYLRLLAPFEAIAGDQIFQGRQRELDQLRSYIGVLAPASLLARLRSIAFKWAKPGEQPALSISGPGGVGKSALIARFMLEHTRLPEEARIPFAYLDFDRASMDVGDPVGLCGEMIRQLDTQFPGGNRFDSLRSFAANPGHSVQLRSPKDQLGAARSLLADLLGQMRTVLGERPYVVVLDTFEEVQYRGEARAYPLWEMFSEFQHRAPFLRVVISGRAPVESLRLAGRGPYHIEVGDLDQDAAMAFLAAQGIGDQRLAAQLVRYCGGVPLSLKLAASLAVRSGGDVSGLGAPNRRGGHLVSLSDEVIQGQLYERILDHIRNEQVRRLAHPGLVLRRISPEVILGILNEPCELHLTNPQQAQALFDELRHETSLVAVDDLDGALVHRADVRRIMLKLLIQSEPDRVERIRQAAVEFYARQPGRRGKAEEIYHRLHLGQRVDNKELSDGEVRSSIQSAVMEFPLDTQLWLATLGLKVAQETFDQATLEQHDASQAAQIEELLPYGSLSEAQAEQMANQATSSLTRPSPLFRAAARVAMQQQDKDRAQEWIEQGLEQSVPAGATKLTLGLLQEQAWLRRDSAAEDRAQILGQLAEYAERHRHREALLQHRLQTIGQDDGSAMHALATLGDALQQTDPAEVWGLTLAFRPAVTLSLRAPDGGVIEQVRSLILAAESPFRYAVFTDRRAQGALESVLRDAEQRASRFGPAFLDLCEAWPYQILFVHPPYGRTGEQLSESA